MPGLKLVLQLKIAVTALLWCLPLLTFSSSLFVRCGVPAPAPMVFVRLLGAAYLTLLVAYYSGMRGIDRGVSPLPTLLVGISGNGLAFFILLIYGLGGAWSDWGRSAQIFCWISTAGALLMTTLLLLFLLRVVAQRRGTSDV